MRSMLSKAVSERRNVPNQLNPKQFVERLDELGFQGMYNFVYVPLLASSIR